MSMNLPWHRSSLARWSEATSRYGLVVVDECHHVPAPTFERAVRQIPVRRWMYCGPIRHRMAPSEAAQLLHRQVVVHTTSHVAIPGELNQETIAGRTVRPAHLRPALAKQDVVVHDYVDALVPVLARMYRERVKGYATLGSGRRFSPTEGA